MSLLSGKGLRYKENGIAPGAQTERRGVAGPWAQARSRNAARSSPRAISRGLGEDRFLGRVQLGHGCNLLTDFNPPLTRDRLDHSPAPLVGEGGAEFRAIRYHTTSMLMVVVSDGSPGSVIVMVWGPFFRRTSPLKVCTCAPAVAKV